MIKRPYIAIIAILLLMMLTAIIPQRSYALNCATHITPDVYYDQYDGVIIAKVKNIEHFSYAKILTVDVIKSYKGVTERKITIREDSMWGESQSNITYLFFLEKLGNTWSKPLCSPTTTDITLAELYLADKAELPLQPYLSLSSIINHIIHSPFILTFVVIIFLLLCSVIILFISRRKK